MMISHCIRESLKHRGKDSGWEFKSNDVVIGQVNSDKTLKQPIFNQKTNLCISFDGHIYNKKKLTQDLLTKHKFNGVNILNHQEFSDAELVLSLYENDGQNFLTKINGKFAFCLWDSSNKLLLLARDHIGIKPIYYYHKDDLFIAASEIKGIFSCPEVPKHPNELCIYEYLMRHHPTSPEATFFHGIKALTPATYLVFTNDTISTVKYWTPNAEKYDLLSTDEEFNTAFCHLFQDIINLRLPTQHFLGTYVSGGLDSSIITFIIEHMLRDHGLNDRVRERTHQLFSAVYTDRESAELKTVITNQDERLAIKEVSASLGKEVNYVYPTITGKWSDIKTFIHCIEEPVAVLNYYVFWSLYQHSQGVDVIFHGEGADTLIGGLNADARILYLKKLWKQKAVIKLFKELINSRDWIIPFILYTIYFNRKLESDTKKLLQPDLVHQFENKLKSMSQTSFQDTITTGLREQVLECLRVNDRASSLCNLDVRYPYLDYRLVELAYSLPIEQRFRDGYTKYLLRNSMKGVLPEYIRRNRNKAGTPIPTKSWLTELKPQINEMLISNNFMTSQYVNQKAIAEAFEKYWNNKYSRFEEWYYGMLLWKIVNLELWFRAYFQD